MRLLILVLPVALLLAGCFLFETEPLEPGQLDPVELLGRELPGVNARHGETRTTFQTHSGYESRFDIKTGSVIVYSDRSERIASWADRGYEPMVMGGPRLSKQEVQRRGMTDEVQKSSNGEMLGHPNGAVYLAPGPTVTDWAADYFKKAAQAGAKTIIPEEPEYFVKAGYSDFFKREWQRFYGEPWSDPAGSVNARYKAEKLKSHLEARFLREVFSRVKKDHPDVRCFVAEHSPVNYALWGITCPHYEMCRDFRLEGIVAQAWSDTARTPVLYEGERRTRTFEHAFLEYSSAWNLARGMKREVWFLSDPLGDVPDLPIDEYRSNYRRTVVASLMFPGADGFEVMPWPERIFGSIPDDYATEITSTVQALNGISRSRGAKFRGGTRGIATFMADTAMWQRGRPCRSSLDGLYGMTLPLLLRGIPAEVAQLECARNPQYLERYSVLLLSYDFLKPASPKIHSGLARWVEDGGVLVFFGGADEYNAVDEWWQDSGVNAPHRHLLKELGLQAEKTEVVNPALSPGKMQTVLEEKRRLKNLENKRVYEIDLSAVKGRHLLISVGDSHPDDGWGACLTRMTLFADNRRVAGFDTFTPREKSHIVIDGGSRTSTDARVIDGDEYVIYHFDRPDADRLTMTIDVGNQFLIKAMASQGPPRLSIRRPEGLEATALPGTLPLGPSHTVVVQPAGRVKPLYELPDTGKTVAWEKPVGDGLVMFFGLEPRVAAESPEGAELLRGIVRRACEFAGVEYREKSSMTIRRGRFVAVKTFDQSLTLQGDFVNVFSSQLPLRSNPVIKTQSCGLWMDVSDRTGGRPRLLWTSANIAALNEETDSTGMFCSGPAGTTAAARLWRGRKLFKTIQACRRDGEPVDVVARPDGRTILLTWPNEADGAAIRVTWR